MRGIVTLKAETKLEGSFEPLLKRFSDKTERGILRASLRRTSQQVIIKEAKANLKQVGGRRFLKDMTVKTSVTMKRAVARIGAKVGTPLSKIGHLIEGGTRPHVILPKRRPVMISKDGIFRGRRVEHPGTRAKPWLNPAMEENRQRAITKFGDLVVDEMEKAIRKGKL